MRNKLANALIAAAMALLPATTCLAATATTTKAAKTIKERNRWPAETLGGKISMVDSARNLVVIQDSSGVPFDMVVNRSTRIKSSSGTLSLNQLNADLNHDASIKFIPEGRGDIAEMIDISQ